MAIASLNVNGLRGRLGEVELLLIDLCIHVLALNETRLDRKVPKELSDIRGYQQFRLDRTCSGGGMLVYIRDAIKAKHMDDVPSDTLELLCIEIEPTRSRSYFVIAWYQPPSDPVGSFDKLVKLLLTLIERVRK